MLLVYLTMWPAPYIFCAMVSYSWLCSGLILKFNGNARDDWLPIEINILPSFCGTSLKFGNIASAYPEIDDVNLKGTL